MADRPRILVFEAPDRKAADLLEARLPDHEIVPASSLGEGLALLRMQRFEGAFAAAPEVIWQRASSLIQADYIVQALDTGVALVSPDLRVTWANATFEKWCGGDVKGRPFYDALGSPEIIGPDYCPLHTALAGRTVTTRLHRQDHRYLELHVTPVADAAGKVCQLISLARDITPEVQRQQKLDAIHQAGRELSALSAAQLADMSVEERVELLKDKIRRFTHDLLQYNVVEVRLLDRKTGQLMPLLEEGMTPEAATRVLYAQTENNGVTGFVAATGKSYLCVDATTDPLYIQGAAGARSSLTAPLTWGDEVVGTFNVESPQPGAFGEQDLQFLEIFSREIANALHTLELLTAEKRTAAVQSVDAISRAVALPVDEILAAATAILERWIGHEPEMADKLRQVLASARSIKQAIQKVGEDLAHELPPDTDEQPSHPRLKGMRALVADSDERVRGSAHTLLGKLGCIVETARTGKEALTMARLGQYDAILVDVRLPDMSGYDAYCGLRLAQPLARVILMAGYGYDPTHTLVKARQDGPCFVLYKPFRVDQMIGALETPDAPGGPSNNRPAEAVKA